MTASIDVIIPTHNRHDRLAKTLASLAHQTVHGFGVIVVDDASSPPVSAPVLCAAPAAGSVRVVRIDANRGPAAARNLGVAASTADYLAFFDDDVDAAPDCLERLVSAIDGAARRVVFGPLRSPADWQPTPWNLWEARTLEREYRRMKDGRYEPTWRQFFTGNALIRRADLLAAGGFNEAFSRAEDIELGIRLANIGCHFVFAPEAMGWHYSRRSLASWLNIPRQYAAADVAIDHLYPQLGWLSVVAGELSRRRRPVLLARKLLPSAGARRGGARLAVHTAQLLFRLGRRSSAMQALSLAYDLEYQVAFRAAIADSAAGESQPSRPRANQEFPHERAPHDPLPRTDTRPSRPRPEPRGGRRR